MTHNHTLRVVHSSDTVLFLESSKEQPGISSPAEWQSTSAPYPSRDTEQPVQDFPQSSSRRPQWLRAAQPAASLTPRPDLETNMENTNYKGACPFPSTKHTGFINSKDHSLWNFIYSKGGREGGREGGRMVRRSVSWVSLKTGLTLTDVFYYRLSAYQRAAIKCTEWK